MDARTVTAVYNRDAVGHWTVRLVEEPRCHTWGRSLLAAQKAIREAADLWLGELGVADSGELKFIEHFEVADLDDAIALKARRVELTAELNAVREASEHMAVKLLGEDFSVRDVATLVGLTPGRISQIAPGGRR